MFDIGFWELLLIAVVALVIVGPERIPKLARVTGLWIGKANASIQSVRNEISRELRAEELQQALKESNDLPDLNKTRVEANKFADESDDLPDLNETRVEANKFADEPDDLPDLDEVISTDSEQTDTKKDNGNR